MSFVAAHRRRRPRRWRPSPWRCSADHPPVPVVNRDASRFFAGSDIGEHARHAEPGRDGCPDTAGRRHAVPRLWSGGRTHQRSRCAHDHNDCRSPPGRDSGHKETAAPGRGRPDPIGKIADDQRGNNCDIAPACVPGTVWRTVPRRTCQLGSAPCLPRSCSPGDACTTQLQSGTAATANSRLPLALTHIAGTPRCAAVPGSRWPSGVTPRMKRRQIYADSDRHRHTTRAVPHERCGLPNSITSFANA
jgi:hypothetical protein